MWSPAAVCCVSLLATINPEAEGWDLPPGPLVLPSLPNPKRDGRLMLCLWSHTLYTPHTPILVLLTLFGQSVISSKNCFKLFSHVCWLNSNTWLIILYFFLEHNSPPVTLPTGTFPRQISPTLTILRSLSFYLNMMRSNIAGLNIYG